MIDFEEIANQYLLLFANCFPVKGYTRCMICDIQRRKAFFIDNSYYDLLMEAEKASIGEILLMLEDDSKQEFEKFLLFMLKNNLGIIVDDLKLFPKISTEWHHPSKITNAIIDIRQEIPDFTKILSELDELGCLFIEIRSYDNLSVASIKKIISLTPKMKFKNIHFIIKYKKGEKFQQDLHHLTFDNRFINITVHSVPTELTILSKSANLAYIHQPINSCDNCGIINKGTLRIPSLEGFMENINFNGCLNRKISVDEKGNIKNCPSMKKDFGNILNTSLINVVEKEEFKKNWLISKDQIDVCKDCEYRYICTDCRAYTMTGDLFSKPSKCGYDPYSGVWA